MKALKFCSNCDKDTYPTQLDDGQGNKRDCCHECQEPYNER